MTGREALEELPGLGVTKLAIQQACLTEPGKAAALQSEARVPPLLPLKKQPSAPPAGLWKSLSIGYHFSR